MAYRVLRVSALIVAIFLGFTSAAAAGTGIPQLDTSRPHYLPGYPDAARRAGDTGIVVVAIHVNELGKPFDVRVDKSSGAKALDDAAVFAVRGWRYLPAERDGVSVAAWTAAGFRFDAGGVTQIPVSPETDTAIAERSQVICRTLAPATGSNINDKPVCMPRWKWEEQARQMNAKGWNKATRPAMGGQTPNGR